MLGIRHHWDAATLHRHATVCCGLIRSLKLSQVRLGQSFDWEASKQACSGVTGSDGVDSSGGALLSGSAPGPLRPMWQLCLVAWLWPRSSHWRPPALVVRAEVKRVAHVPVPTSATPLNQKGVRKPPYISRLIPIGSIVDVCILTQSFILSYSAAVF